MPVKILLADKSITIQKVVEMLFSGRDYEVVCVSDGEMALNEATRVVPDVVLVDVDLPRIDGYSFAARLKQTPQLTQTPVILMMSRDDVFDGAKGKQAGIVDNIAKPFESQELIGKVKKALGAAPPRAAEPAPPSARQPAAPAPPVRSASPPEPTAPLKPKKAAPADIFDIISEAPTHADLTRAAAATKEDTVYEVEPVVEEIEEPLSREEGAKALPIGAKAVEEIRIGLGLTGEKDESKPGIVTYESLEAALKADPQAAFKPGTPGPSSQPFRQPSVQTPMLSETELRRIAEETIAKMARDVFSKLPPVQPPKISDDSLRAMVDEKVANLTKEALAKMPAPQPQVPAITVAEVRKISEDMVAKMAKDIVAIIPTAQPQISPETLRAMVAEEVEVKTKETLAAMPQPSTFSAGEARGIAEEVVAKAAKDILAQIPPAQPQISPETLLAMVAKEVTSKTKETLAAMPQPSTLSAGEARGIAEEVVAKAAKDIIAQIPPAQPQISPETIRAMIAEDVANKTKETLAAMPQPSTLSAGDVRGIAEEVVAKAAKDIIAQIPPAQPQISLETLRAMVVEEVASKANSAGGQSSPVTPSALTASDMWSMAEEAVQRIAQEYFDKQSLPQTPQLSDEALRAMVEAQVSTLTKETLEKMPAARTADLSPSDMWSVADEAVERIAREFFEKQPMTQSSLRAGETQRSMREQATATTVDDVLERKAISQQASIPMSEMRKMAEETVSRMALEIFSDMTPPIPKISEDTVRRGIEDAVMKIAREVAREVIEKVAWETIPQLAEVMIKEEIGRLKAEP